MGSKPFQPGFIIVVEASFVKVDQIYTKIGWLFQ
jgi:hypothetical protein